MMWARLACGALNAKPRDTVTLNSEIVMKAMTTIRKSLLRISESTSFGIISSELSAVTRLHQTRAPPLLHIQFGARLQQAQQATLRNKPLDVTVAYHRQLAYVFTVHNLHCFGNRSVRR